MPQILLIDDDDSLREILAKSLQQEGYHVVQAGDGLQAMDIARITALDLVITDLVMPGQEGFETITLLRQNHPNLPVIAISGNLTHSPVYGEIAQKVGATQVLAKPFTLAALHTAVAQVLSSGASP